MSIVFVLLLMNIFLSSYQEWWNARLSAERAELVDIIVWEWNQWNFSWWDGKCIINDYYYSQFFLVEAKILKAMFFHASLLKWKKNVFSDVCFDRVLARLYRPFHCWVTWSTLERFQALILLSYPSLPLPIGCQSLRDGAPLLELSVWLEHRSRG